MPRIRMPWGSPTRRRHKHLRSTRAARSPDPKKRRLEVAASKSNHCFGSGRVEAVSTSIRGGQLRGTVKRIASKALKESSVLFVAFLSAESSYASCCPERLWVCRFQVGPKLFPPRIQQSQEKRPVHPGPRTARVSTAIPTS